MSPEARADYLKVDNGMKVAHQASANEGQTEVNDHSFFFVFKLNSPHLFKSFQTPDAEEDVDLHFIAFIRKDGDLYEMDGGNESPINHGPTSEETFLEVQINNLVFLTYFRTS